MIVQNNIMALSANRQAATNSLKLQASLQKLASGYRINSAADDAAGLAISERMRAQMTGLERAMMNARDGTSMVQTAEGALTEVHSMLNRLSELAVQASNGTLNAGDRGRIQAESQSILKEIDRISGATNFNGINLLDGSLAGNGQGSVSVSGVKADAAAAEAGVYSFDAIGDRAGLKAGDTLEYTLALNNGDAYTMQFTVSDSLDSLVAGDGSVIALGNAPNADGVSVDVDGGELASALVNRLQDTSLAGSFTIQEAGGALTLTSRVAGTAAPQVAGLSESVNGGTYQAVARDSAASAAPSDGAATIAQGAFTVFDGSNAGSAVFEANGSRFALVADSSFAADVGKLDSDVTAIRVSGTALQADDMRAIAATVNHRTGLALEASADGSTIAVKAPGGGGLSMQVGDTADSYNQVLVNVGNMSSAGLGLSGISMSSAESASRALSRISAAIDRVSENRGNLGAMQNRLEHTISNLGVTNENLSAAESRIRDTDMAKLLIEFTKRSVLTQSAQAMQAQANMNTQQVLQLLR